MIAAPGAAAAAVMPRVFPYLYLVERARAIRPKRPVMPGCDADPGLILGRSNTIFLALFSLRPEELPLPGKKHGLAYPLASV